MEQHPEIETTDSNAAQPHPTRLTASRRRQRPKANCASLERCVVAFGLPLNEDARTVRDAGCQVRGSVLQISFFTAKADFPDGRLDAP
jgi:hypothetical protein